LLAEVHFSKAESTAPPSASPRVGLRGGGFVGPCTIASFLGNDSQLRILCLDSCVLDTDQGHSFIAFASRYLGIVSAFSDA
jgi:hypothetical protein